MNDKQIKYMNCNNDEIYHIQVVPVSVVNSDWFISVDVDIYKWFISVDVDIYKKNLSIKLMYSLRENVLPFPVYSRKDFQLVPVTIDVSSVSDLVLLSSTLSSGCVSVTGTSSSSVTGGGFGGGGVGSLGFGSSFSIIKQYFRC
jgi:uncharacterized membrane protein YgcG